MSRRDDDNMSTASIDSLDTRVEDISDKRKMLIALCARDQEWCDILYEIADFTYGTVRQISARHMDSIRKIYPGLPRGVTAARNMLDGLVRVNPALRASEPETIAAMIKWLQKQRSGVDKVIMSWRKDLKKKLEETKKEEKKKKKEESSEEETTKSKSTEKLTKSRNRNGEILLTQSEFESDSD